MNDLKCNVCGNIASPKTDSDEELIMPGLLLLPDSYICKSCWIRQEYQKPKNHTLGIQKNEDSSKKNNTL
jgi:hypothetical protein